MIMPLRLFRPALALLALLAMPPLMAQATQDVPAKAEPLVYEVDSLAPMAAPGDVALQMDTPQSLLESFFDAAAAQDWARAAQALDRGNLAPGDASPPPPELARQLYALLHRSIALDWTALPDRPDALLANASDKQPQAGEARRNLVLGHLTLGERSIPLRVTRVQLPGGDPVWVFGRQTVENVPALYAKYGPTAFERAMPAALRAQAFWTLAWWEVIVLPLVLLLAVGAAALTYLLFRRLAQGAGENGLAAKVLYALAMPAALFALAGTFIVLRQSIFTFSSAVNNILDPVQVTLIVVAIGAIVVAALDAVIGWVLDRRTESLADPQNAEDRDFYTSMSAVRRIIVVMVVIAGLGIALVQSDLTQTLGFSLIASAGVIGLLLLFAGREVLGDLMASIQIAFAKTARIGDAVHYEGQWCYVERIGFTHVRLRTWDDRRVMVPVGEFVGSSFENWTKTDPHQTMHVELLLDHRADVDALREAFREFVDGEDDVIDKDEASVSVIDHSAQAKTVRFIARAEDAKTGWAMHCRLREHMVAAAARLDTASEREPDGVFLKREREFTTALD